MKKFKEMTRREFLAAGAGVAGAAVLSTNAYSHRRASGGWSAPRPALLAPSETRVVLVKTQDRAEGVKRCLDLLKINPFKGKSVLVKPNFNTSDETPGSTHNDTLKALLAWIRDMGAKGLAIGDRSGPEPTEEVFDKKGIRALAGSFNAALLNFDELGETGYIKITPPGSHWKDGFLVARPVVETECVVSTCCLKTHQYGGVFTMSLKNSVGVVPRKGNTLMRELHASPDQRRMIAEINFAYRPALIVLDGLQAFVDEGPMTGPRKDAGVFVAGTDRVAVDAVGVAILKDLGSNDAIMKPAVFAQEQIVRAVELGLGISSAADIVIETPDAASEAYAEKIRGILMDPSRG
jgi:uncharacterized protein (DUF362 family)